MTMCGKYTLVAAMLLLALLRPLGELLALVLFFPLPRKRLAGFYRHGALLCERLLCLGPAPSVRLYLLLDHATEPLGVDALGLLGLDLDLVREAKVVPVVADEVEHLGRGGLCPENVLRHAVAVAVLALDETDPKRLLEAHGEFAQAHRCSSFMSMTNLKEGQPRRQVTDGSSQEGVRTPTTRRGRVFTFWGKYTAGGAKSLRP